MATAKQIEELMQMARDSMKYGPIMCELLKQVHTTPAPRIKLDYWVTEQTPYGIVCRKRS